MGSSPEEILVRPVTFRDTAAVGMLLQAALSRSPSSKMDVEDISDEAFIAGSDVVEPAVISEEVLLIAEIAGDVAGMAHVKRKELVRSRHVGRLELIIHPDAPGLQVGRELLTAALDASGHRGFFKIVLDVSAPDRVLQEIVDARGGWWAERVRPGALTWGGEKVDVTTWAHWIREGPGTSAEPPRKPAM